LHKKEHTSGIGGSHSTDAEGSSPLRCYNCGDWQTVTDMF